MQAQSPSPGGDLTADLDRLVAIARVIDSRCESYRVTLDGNEQYGDVEGIVELREAMALDQRLARLQGSVTSLRIDGGQLAIGSLAGPGFASAAMPRWQDMREMT